MGKWLDGSKYGDTRAAECSRWMGGCLRGLSYSLATAICVLQQFSFLLFLPLSVWKDTGGLFVHLYLCLTHQFYSFRVVIITAQVLYKFQKRCNYGWGDDVRPGLDGEGDTHQLCLLPSFSVLFHQQITDWLHKVLEKKERIFHIMLHSSFFWSRTLKFFKHLLICVFLLVHKYFSPIEVHCWLKTFKNTSVSPSVVWWQNKVKPIKTLLCCSLLIFFVHYRCRAVFEMFNILCFWPIIALQLINSCYNYNDINVAVSSNEGVNQTKSRMDIMILDHSAKFHSKCSVGCRCRLSFSE